MSVGAGGNGSPDAGAAGEGGGSGTEEECFPAVPDGPPPVLFYDFDDDTEATIDDKSGNDRLGTLNGGSWIAGGRHGRALKFQAGEYATISGAFVHQLEAMTVAAWVRLDAAPAGATLFEFGTDATNRIALTVNTDPGMRFGTTAGTEEEYVALPRALPVNAWVHVATVLADGKAILYVNGLEMGRISTKFAPSDLPPDSDAWIGRSHEAEVDLEWSVDDFRIYDRGLSREEVAELAIPDYLYFDFDEPCGNRAHDRSKKALVGELPNGGSWVPGQAGGALELDGSEQYVALPPGIVKDCRSFSLSVWVQRSKADALNEHIIDFGQNQRTFMYLSPQGRGNAVRFAIKFNGAENDINAEHALLGPMKLQSFLWQHVAIVLDDTTGFGALYVNGTQYSSAALPERPSTLGETMANTIGRSQYYNAALSPDPFYAGAVDELRIACRVFSVAEIAFLAMNP